MTIGAGGTAPERPRDATESESGRGTQAQPWAGGRETKVGGAGAGQKEQGEGRAWGKEGGDAFTGVFLFMLLLVLKKKCIGRSVFYAYCAHSHIIFIPTYLIGASDLDSISYRGCPALKRRSCPWGTQICRRVRSTWPVLRNSSMQKDGSMQAVLGLEAVF